MNWKVLFRGWVLLAGGMATWLISSGCQRETETRWQGYLEGEFVYVASPLAGRLERLAVSRGTMVAKGEVLFVLDRTVEMASREEAIKRLAQAEATLADLRKGQRPSEIAALAARLEQARASQELARIEAERTADLFARNVVSAAAHDRARFAYQRDSAQVHELEAQLDTAQLGARADSVAGAEAQVAGARAAVEKAAWGVTEKAPVAPVAALIYDTLFRQGEWVNAGQPVVALLPPENLKVRFFVPEAVRSSLTVGETVQVSFTGDSPAKVARVTYLSPQAEFTPPVLYNRENRAKLVFMIEAEFEDGAGVELLPGQPVDVSR